MVTSSRSKWAVGKREEGAYLKRYVTDEQRGRRPIFNATLRAGASWLFFCVARSTRLIQIWALRSRLEKQPTDLRRRHHYLRDGTLARKSHGLKVSIAALRWRESSQWLRGSPWDPHATIRFAARASSHWSTPRFGEAQITALFRANSSRRSLNWHSQTK
jgi:hypothetical protein